MVAHDFVSKLETPTTYIEAMRSNEKVFWNRAMNSEIESFKENQTGKPKNTGNNSEFL